MGISLNIIVPNEFIIKLKVNINNMIYSFNCYKIENDNPYYEFKNYYLSEFDNENIQKILNYLTQNSLILYNGNSHTYKLINVNNLLLNLL